MSQRASSLGPRGAPGELLSVDLDVTVLRFLRRGTWLWAPIANRVAILVCMVLSRYPTWRLAASAALISTLLAPMLVMSRGERGERTRRVATVLLWVALAQVYVNLAITGGFRSPFALSLLVTVSTVLTLSRMSHPGRRGLALCIAGIFGLALLPERWAGPTLPAPWFTLIVCLSSIETLLLNMAFSRSMLETASAAVSEAISAREELADEALARAGELERVGSQLSHELRNPLAAVKTLVQLSSRSAVDAATRKRLGVVEGEIERMVSILQSHLSFSRPLDQYHPSIIELGGVVDAVLTLLRGRAQAAGVSLRRTGDASAMADPHRLKEALINLIANAIEACPRDADVEVSVDGTATEVLLRVKDTGRGMSPEVLACVGTPFFTTRERGTGLGVTLARTVFEQHGGALDFESEPGRGTTAIGRLPREGPSQPRSLERGPARR